MGTKVLDPVEVSCFFFAPPNNVFDSWIKPEWMRKWLFVGPTSEIVKIDLDLKIQGNFSILEYEKSNGEYIDHFGKYTAIDRPGKLAFTLTVPKHFQGETNVSIEITSNMDGADLRLKQTGVPKEVTEQSWRKMLSQLKLVLENG